MKREDPARFGNEPAPDLWPEIERRLEEPGRLGVTQARRGRMPVTAVAVLLMVGGLAWGLLTLTRAIHPAHVASSPGSITRIRLSGPPQPIVAGYGAAWTVVGVTAGETYVERIDAITGKARALPQTKGAQWIAAGEGAAWVTVCPTGQVPCGGAAVLKLDPASGKVVAKISVPDDGVQIVVGLDSVWASSGQELLRIDPSTNRVVARLPFMWSLRGAAYGTIWASSDRDVVRLDPGTGAILARIRAPLGDACDVAVGDEGIWISSCSAFSGPDRLVRIDPTTNSVLWSTAITGDPMLATGAGFLWLSSSPSGANFMSVRRYDPTTNEFVGRTVDIPYVSPPFVVPGPPAGGTSVFLAVSQDAVWLSDITDGEVIRIQLPLG